jgi:hypothetical protein
MSAGQKFLCSQPRHVYEAFMSKISVPVGCNLSLSSAKYRNKNIAHGN